jgi:hypothetical protein
MDKKITIKEKILTFLEKKGISKADFYAETGIESSNFKGKNKDSLPGSAMLVKILTIYPDLSADWLLTGTGEMLKTKSISKDTSAASKTLSLSNKDTENNLYEQEKSKESLVITQLIDTIKQQAEEIGRLKARIDELERCRGDNAYDAQTSSIANAG